MGRPGLPSGRAARNYVVSNYKRNAAKRDLEWALSENQFDELTQGDCHYCGVPPSTVWTPKIYNGAFTYNGIDRKNSSLGYTIGNVVSCCKTCQKCKSSLPYDVFIEFLKRAGQFQLRGC